MVTNRKKKGKQTQNTPARKIKGVKMNKPRSTFVYRPKISKPARTMETESENIDLFKLKNQFDLLRNQDDTIMETDVGDLSGLNKGTTINDSDSESEVEELENMDIVNVVAVSQSSQVMHVKIIHKIYGKQLFCTLVYASNNPFTRRPLWSDLEMHKLVTRSVPWTLIGDFNVALNLEDYSSISSKLSSAISDFKDCVYNIEVMDVNSSGLQFTWNQKPKGEGGLLKKLDRIMGNTEFIDAFPVSYALFQLYRISDHSPAVLHIPNLPCCKPKPFKFFNFLDHKRQFKEMELDSVQKALDLNRSDVYLREEEAIYVQAFMEAKLDEERGRIDTILNSANKEVTGMNVADVFVSHYEMFLGSDMACDMVNTDGLFLKQVLGESSINMVKPVSGEEIKAAMFSIGDDCAPGPDGFSSAFLKKGWDIVGGDVCHAICDFFVNGRLLKEINHTFIALIPKIINGIKEVVSDNQSAFILDDLFIFARGDVESARLIMEALEEFKCTSGLVPSLPKSTTFFCNVSNHVKFAILSIMTFSEEDLPLKKGQAKVAWDDICLPKQEGGLGLCSLDVFNMALISTHIWNIVSNKESLWVRWIHTYKIRNRSFWSLPLTKDVSWGWLKLLQLREQVRPFLWVKLGNGKSFSIWYDSWCAYSPLINFISPRDIYREGFKLSSKVVDLVVNNAWSWPQTWITKAPILLHILAPNLDVHIHDEYRWRGLNGSFSGFSVTVHGMLLDPVVMSAQQDSHAHLFFECAYSSQVWKLVRPLTDMESVQPILHDIISYIQPMAHKRTVRRIFGKLILAVATYFVWLERNNRLFKKTKRTPKELKDVIMITVRLKLLSFLFKNSVKLAAIGRIFSTNLFSGFPHGLFLSLINISNFAQQTGKLETSYEEVEGVCGGSAAKGVFGVQVAYKEVMEITSRGWPFVFVVLGQMAHLVASITLDSARSYVMQNAFLTQGTVFSIHIVFNWSDGIRFEGFLSSVLLWLVIIVAVVGVGVTVVVVVESSSVIKLSFVIT
ncbi:hypothetical protein Tco_0158362 [Tanacetum coccineum]